MHTRSDQHPQACREGVDWREAGLLLVLLAGIVLAWRTPVVWPLKILVVFFHELSHALAALATGGSVVHIEVVAGEGGLAITAGGNRFVILCAGYLGSLAWGGAALTAAARTRADRGLTAALGIVILLATALWVRPLLSFGFGFHLLAGAALIAAGTALPEAVCDGILKVFGLTSCLYVVPDIYSDTIARASLPSDARLLAELTLVPTMVWGGLWIALSVAASLALLRAACRRRPPSLRAAA